MLVTRSALGFVAFALLSVQIAHADLVAYSLTGAGGNIGPSYSQTQSVTKDGVSFDATLTVLGLGDIHQNAAGLGVVGNGSDAVSDGESLYFSMSIDNVVGGDAFFDGFSNIKLINYTGTGVLSSDFSYATSGDNFGIFTTASGVTAIVDANLTSVLPQTFFAIAQPNVGNPSAFRVSDITGSFSVLSSMAVVPEPTAFLFGSLVAGCVGMVAVRRRPSREEVSAV